MSTFNWLNRWNQVLLLDWVKNHTHTPLTFIRIRLITPGYIMTIELIYNTSVLSLRKNSLNWTWLCVQTAGMPQRVMNSCSCIKRQLLRWLCSLIKRRWVGQSPPAPSAAGTPHQNRRGKKHEEHKTLSFYFVFTAGHRNCPQWSTIDLQ